MVEWVEGNTMMLYLTITHHIEGLPTHGYQMVLTEQEVHNFISNTSPDNRALTYALYCIKRVKGEGFENEEYRGKYTYTACIYNSDGVETELEYEGHGVFTIDGYDARRLDEKIREAIFEDAKAITSIA